MRVLWTTLLTAAAVLAGVIFVMSDGMGDPPQAEGNTPPAVVGDMIADLQQVEEKLVALAEILTVEQYAWRPMEGVRAAGEVFMHVAADNYFLPVLAGFEAPPETQITMDYSTVQTFENRVMDREQTIRNLERSFSYLRGVMATATEEDLSRELSYFGQTSTLGAFWLRATTHVHEHLGQSIAYARANGVVPPWSQ